MNAQKPYIFFTGIGGVGMSGLAELLLRRGYKVAGSDRQLSSITDYLQEIGVRVFEGHAAENVQGADMLVYTSAVNMENPERREAERLGIRQRRRAELLADLMLGKTGIAVAGTHGKTTTTSMISEILIRSGFDPTVVIGGRLGSLKTSARPGDSEYFVTEADEYDRSFLALSPTHAVVTNIESDHLDIYGDLEHIKSAFRQFVNRVPFFGTLAYCCDDPLAVEIAQTAGCRTIGYGLSPEAGLRAKNIAHSGQGSAFEVDLGGPAAGKFELSIPGEHNIRNALAAIAMARAVNVPVDKIKSALATFSGVERRFQIKGEIKGIMVVDDYAHHPSEIEATLMAARDSWQRRTIAVFQPHLFSRTRDFYRPFATALSAADIVVLAPIYPAREEPIEGVSAKLISDQIAAGKVILVDNKMAVAEKLMDIVQAGDVVITMGAGDIWQQGERFLEILTEAHN